MRRASCCRDASKFGGFMCLINGAHGDKVNVVPYHHVSADGTTIITSMVPARDIKPAEELHWDYEGTCTKKEEAIHCACGCNGWLFKYVPPQKAKH